MTWKGWLKMAFVAAGTAAAAGASQGVTDLLSSGQTNPKTLGTAAMGGALAGVIGLLIKRPQDTHPSDAPVFR